MIYFQSVRSSVLTVFWTCRRSVYSDRWTGDSYAAPRVIVISIPLRLILVSFFCEYSLNILSYSILWVFYDSSLLCNPNNFYTFVGFETPTLNHVDTVYIMDTGSLRWRSMYGLTYVACVTSGFLYVILCTFCRNHCPSIGDRYFNYLSISV